LASSSLRRRLRRESNLATRNPAGRSCRARWSVWRFLGLRDDLILRWVMDGAIYGEPLLRRGRSHQAADSSHWRARINDTFGITFRFCLIVHWPKLPIVCPPPLGIVKRVSGSYSGISGKYISSVCRMYNELPAAGRLIVWPFAAPHPLSAWDGRCESGWGWLPAPSEAPLRFGPGNGLADACSPED